MNKSILILNTAMEDNVKSFLEKLQEQKDKKIKVWVNSLSAYVESTPLSFKQQKDLISTITDGTIGALKFQKFINDAIIENTGIKTLLVSDKLPIILQLRQFSLGETIKMEGEDVALTPIIEKSKKVDEIKPLVIENGFIVNVECPTLVEENKVIQSTIEALKKDGDKDIGKSIGNVYTYEIVKYIKSVEFDDKGVEFENISVKNRVEIVENLPITINTEIVQYIQKLKKEEHEILTVVVDGNDKTIEIDVSFFDS